MTAKITRIYDRDGGEVLVVPGTEPAQILKDAAGELDTGEKIYAALENVKVGWWRVSPCHENSCWEGGGHTAHWNETPRLTRGGFQAAGIEIGTDADYVLTSADAPTEETER